MIFVWSNCSAVIQVVISAYHCTLMWPHVMLSQWLYMLVVWELCDHLPAMQTMYATYSLWLAGQWNKGDWPERWDTGTDMGKVCYHSCQCQVSARVSGCFWAYTLDNSIVPRVILHPDLHVNFPQRGLLTLYPDTVSDLCSCWAEFRSGYETRMRVVMFTLQAPMQSVKSFAWICQSCLCYHTLLHSRELWQSVVL